ncbi:long-chain fatty acid--CoA ligase [Cytobacillus purgationiresistens]|uniref:Fatty-acyl-CoA synthase n=1 Tax=Cytobacillus purgationiresistens TaxID=863449 RepID=A0ABU0AEU5_9BACI|nr:long-chain fatty acid--CoA ligase [Cytobacillus purgationiresistens]MDQ0269773.1 fatty-acyl-CoA synthase [Cytobacillus purgationiresistens]
MQTRHFEHWPRLPKTLIVPESSIYNNLEVTAARYPNQNAIFFYGKKMTYRELLEEVNSVAGYLQNELKIIKDEKILLFMQNSPQFIISYYAITRAGAVVVPINPMLLSHEMEFYIKDCQIKTAIIGQELYTNIQPLVQTTTLENLLIASYSDYIDKDFEIELPAEVKELPKKWDEDHLHSWKSCIDKNEVPQSYNAHPNDLVVLPYTSGTTGLPKGCMHTHRSVQANVAGGAVWGRVSASNVHLSTLPFFHVTGMVQSMHVPIYTGGTMVIMTRWNRQAALDLIDQQQCTNWIAISTMIIDFISNPKLDAYKVSSLIGISGGGATLPEAVGEKLQQLTGLTFLEGYGLSETIAQTHSNPVERPKMQCLGIPFFDVDARIIDPVTKKELDVNEVGEIIVHGHQVMTGYYNRNEENESAFIELDGKRFFRTGDMGRCDEEGYFFIVDRVKRMINVSGYKVWPTEIESHLYRHPAVQQACVVGIPDERKGESVKAFVILNEDYDGKIDESELVEWSKKQMAAYKYPRVIEFRTKFPMTSSGKILWRKLKEEEEAKVVNHSEV